MNLPEMLTIVRDYGVRRHVEGRGSALLGVSNKHVEKLENEHKQAFETIEKELERLYAIEDRLKDTIANFKTKVDKSNLNFLASDIELLEYILNGEV